MSKHKEYYYEKPIKNQLDAKLFIIGLEADNKSFHFDDPPKDIIDSKGEPLFSKYECGEIEKRLDELFDIIDWGFHGCPHGYALLVMKYRELLHTLQDDDFIASFQLSDNSHQLASIEMAFDELESMLCYCENLEYNDGHKVIRDALKKCFGDYYDYKKEDK